MTATDHHRPPESGRPDPLANETSPDVTIADTADPLHRAGAPSYGRVTIPSESGFAERTAQIAGEWGADAVRNSDGTTLDTEVLALGKKVYTAFFPVRGDNHYI
ncbi:MAG: hypothetical protein KIT69_09250, partial [Propionibacteriaceae bacterium]|nr:hypothetical protein [Propionibacteriaceae bacterium]